MPSSVEAASAAPRLSPLAGKPAPASMLVDVPRLLREYQERAPDCADPTQMVAFGTSGHRGTPLAGTFTHAHILAITQAICEYRAAQGTTGPLYMGRDTHAVSGPAQATALQVLAANGVETIIQRDDGVTPTPVISRAILVHNRGRHNRLADGIVITPSHNPPEDGGFKYNGVNGGPADVDATRWIQNRANDLLKNGNRQVRAVAPDAALLASSTHQEDFVLPYVQDLPNVVDMHAIRDARLTLGVDPLGGAAVHYWEPINRLFGLDIQVVNPVVDPTFRLHDRGSRWQDPHGLLQPVGHGAPGGAEGPLQVAFANDPDSDRHGIVTPSAGLMNPNHYLAVAIDYLLSNRPQWSAHSVVGKTLVSSSMIDRVVASRGRALNEVPVGFKWFTPGLFDGTCCFWRRGALAPKLPAHGWNRVDHGQGRPHHGPAGSRDHRAYRARPRPALRRPGEALWQSDLHAH